MENTSNASRQKFWTFDRFVAVAGLVLVAVSTVYGVRMYYRDAPASPVLQPPAQAASMMPPWWIIALLILGVLLLVTAWIRKRNATSSNVAETIKPPRDDLRRRGQAALRKRAEELARGLYGFVAAQRNRRPDLDDLLRAQKGEPTEHSQLNRFDPWPYALKEYRVQYKDKVSDIYREFFGGSALTKPSSSGFMGKIETMTGSPDDPMSFNEIIAIALEIELKASRLPSE